MRVIILCFLWLMFTLSSCEKVNLNQDNPGQDNSVRDGFLSWSSSGQTLPAAIHTSEMEVRFEVDHDVDVTSLVPEFTVPEGYSVYVNGVEQKSGVSAVNFSKPVSYVLKTPDNKSLTWNATAVPLKKKILVDASHDGGVWWFPQSPLTGYNQALPHQGQKFANILRQKGFEVNELGRNAELTEEMFFGHYIIIRANGFQAYTQKEIKVYSNLLKRGTNMVFFTDHKKYDPVDEIGDLLGLKFAGLANGKITRLEPHIITENITSIDYVAGSVLINIDENSAIQVLGALREEDYVDLNFNGIKDDNEPGGLPVMGIVHYPKSSIFFIGDMNGLEIIPQPFIDNLIRWMGITNW